ncbi:MAG: hypothetical protein IKZ66_02120, partial [Schwartzia sp.]|nr:hypothetical protein [Schwartzia sp. (in: firmicutes)]
MKKKNKLASILLAGSLMFLPVCCHAEAEPSETAAAEIETSEAASGVYEMEKKTTTIYYGNMEAEHKGTIDLYFVNGVDDVPYISVNTAKDVLIRAVRVLDAPA